MSVDDSTVNSAVRRLGRHELDRLEIKDALALIVDVLPSLFAVDGAGILLLDEDRALRHVASSDGAAQILEAIQEERGRGPCVSALLEDKVVVVDDIGTDDRWPELAAELINKGIRGILGVPVHIAGTPVGSLNVHHCDARGWDDSDIRALLTFDRVIEGLLASAVQASRSEVIVEQLRRGLSSRVNIDRAVGMLMGLHQLDVNEAFEMIRRAARSARRTVEEVANEVLENRSLPVR